MDKTNTFQLLGEDEICWRRSEGRAETGPGRLRTKEGGTAQVLESDARLMRIIALLQISGGRDKKVDGRENERKRSLTHYLGVGW